MTDRNEIRSICRLLNIEPSPENVAQLGDLGPYIGLDAVGDGWIVVEPSGLRLP